MNDDKMFKYEKSNKVRVIDTFSEDIGKVKSDLEDLDISSEKNQQSVASNSSKIDYAAGWSSQQCVKLETQQAGCSYNSQQKIGCSYNSQQKVDCSHIQQQAGCSYNSQQPACCSYHSHNSQSNIGTGNFSTNSAQTSVRKSKEYFSTYYMNLTRYEIMNLPKSIVLEGLNGRFYKAGGTFVCCLMNYESYDGDNKYDFSTTFNRRYSREFFSKNEGKPDKSRPALKIGKVYTILLMHSCRDTYEKFAFKITDKCGKTIIDFIDRFYEKDDQTGKYKHIENFAIRIDQINIDTLYHFAINKGKTSIDNFPDEVFFTFYSITDKDYKVEPFPFKILDCKHRSSWGGDPEISKN